MGINGAHVIVYTSEPDEVRRIFRDILRWKHVDVGGDWLIFALPPAELGIHPGEGPNFESGIRHQLSFMCDDIEATTSELRAKGLDVDRDRESLGWGVATTLHLPGGLDVMLYEPRHASAF
ncbi:MAG TPA: hypothetical protein VEJ87_04270 [Acidimicrobiales bacterium]|nr:hypothetical protein [Acidimicrobiales bacterium]